MHSLEADSIRLEYNGRVILSDVYVKCETESITGLLGRNGQGKSCLMQIIYGSRAAERSVRFDGISVRKAFKRADLLNYLPQFNFVPGGLSLKRVFKDFDLDYAQFENRFPEFKLKDGSSVGRLSGGERRLLELYVVVKSTSLFAMLDEPFTHLNPIQIEKVKELLVEEKSRKGLFITDHMFQHVYDCCDSLYLLKDGKTYLTKSLEDIETLGYARL